MCIYFLTFLISLFLYYTISPNLKYKIETEKKSRYIKNKWSINRVKCAIFFASLPPMFISAVRYYVGTDYLRTYYTGFYRMLEGSYIDGFEIGYVALNKIIQLFSDNVFILFAITSIIFVGFIYADIFTLSSNIPCSIILLFVTRYYFISMNGVRQFISLAILTYSIKYIIRKDLKKYIIFLLLAISFHYTSILFTPVYFLSNFKISIKKTFKLIIISTISFRFLNIIALKILSGTKYGALISKYPLCGMKFTIFTITLNIFILVISYLEYKDRINDIKYRSFLNIQIIATIISLLLRIIPLMERVYWIYSFPIIVSAPYLFTGKKNKKIFMYILIIILTIYMVYDIVYLGDHDVIPYNWIFGNKAIHYSGWNWYR